MVWNKLGSVHAIRQVSQNWGDSPDFSTNNHSLTLDSQAWQTHVRGCMTLFGWFAKMTISHDMISYDRIQKYPKWHHHSSGLRIPTILLSNKVQNTFCKTSWSRGFWRRGNDELTVVVKGFPDTADEATLTSHFAACGEVVRVAWFVSMARGDHTIWICRCRFVYKCTVMYRMCVTSALSMDLFCC